jgi:hypothetical protein
MVRGACTGKSYERLARFRMDDGIHWMSSGVGAVLLDSVAGMGAVETGKVKPTGRS